MRHAPSLEFTALREKSGRWKVETADNTVPNVEDLVSSNNLWSKTRTLQRIDRPSNKWLVFILVLLVGVIVALPVVAGSNEVSIDFVYPVHPEETPIRHAARLDDGQVLPYATIELAFSTALTVSEMEEFEAGLRVFRDGRNGAALSHLHELIDGMDIHGPHASFHWREVDDNTVLWYRPFGLDPDGSYRLQMPAGWQTTRGPIAFQTAASTLRTYELIIPDIEDWREVSTTGYSASIRKVPCTIFDRFNPDPERPQVYTGATVKLRGQVSRGWAQKNMTLTFDDEALFEGFEDQYSYQGARRKLVLIGNGSSHSQGIFKNKISFDIARQVETRLLGASWMPDTYYSQWVINGQYWGLYLISEHISSGENGYTDTADRADILGARENAILHKIDSGGRRIRGTNVIPKTDHEIALAQGDGVSTEFALAPPYPLFSLIRSGTPTYYDIDIEVKAKTSSGEKMKLIPDLSSVQLTPSGRQIASVPLMVKDTGEPAGQIEMLNTDFPNILAQFPAPVGSGRPVRVEFNSVYDFQIYDAAMNDAPETIDDWHDLDSVLTYWFITRLLGATPENHSRNTYLLMNWDRLGTFLDSESEALRPREKYRHILWDCDFCFVSGTARPREQDLFHFASAKTNPEARQQYADMFLDEFREGGVLSESFYIHRFEEYAATVDNGYELHGIRWFDNPNIGPDYDQIHETHVRAKLTDHVWIREYLLRLDLDIPTESRFLRGDANLDGVIDLSDAIALVNMLFMGAPSPTTCFIADACDVNDDGSIDIADPVWLFEWLFKGGPAPAGPFPEMGHDPTADGLDA